MPADRTPAMTERREGPRHEPRERRAWLGWRHAAGFRVALAVLVDIGRGGAAAVVADPDPPGPGDLARVYLESGPFAIAEAEVASAEWITTGLWRVRLAFRGVCPPELLQAAILGPEAYRALLN